MPTPIAVDRIEGDRAVLDIGGERVEIPASALPDGAAEGWLLALSPVSADQAIEAAEAQLERLRKKSPPKMNFDL